MEATPTVALVLCGCATTKKPYVIQFQYQEHDDWVGGVAVDAFEVDDQRARQGGYGAFQAQGAVYAGAPCPFCGAASFFYGTEHEKFTCWDGETKLAPCAWCGEKHEVGGALESIDSARGDF